MGKIKQPPITICSYEEAQAYLEFSPGRDFAFAISILNSAQQAPLYLSACSEFKGDLLTLRFDDVEVPYGASIAAGYVPCSPNQAWVIARYLREAAHVLRDAPPKRILVHCTAGISRSTAIGLSFLHVWGVKQLTETLLRLVPDAMPNRYVAELLDSALSANGRIMQAAEKIHQHQRELGR